jgi:TgpA N-terminal domain
VLTPFSSTQHLPREARDTLFLLSVITWVLLPHIDHLPLWCSALAAGVLLWRGRLAWLNHTLPNRWWLLGLLGMTVGATYLTHRTLLGREAGVTLIVVLLALKTLELRAKRDAFVVFFLGFFTMLTNFFYSQSLLTAAAMLMALLGLLTALVLAHMPVGKPPLAQAAKTALGMALLGAPIMAVLFVLFPRVCLATRPVRAPVCPPPCRLAKWRNSHWTKASPCGCGLLTLCHRPLICTSVARCWVGLTDASGDLWPPPACPCAQAGCPKAWKPQATRCATKSR